MSDLDLFLRFKVMDSPGLADLALLAVVEKITLFAGNGLGKWSKFITPVLLLPNQSILFSNPNLCECITLNAICSHHQIEVFESFYID